MVSQVTDLRMMAYESLLEIQNKVGSLNDNICAVAHVLLKYGGVLESQLFHDLFSKFTKTEIMFGIVFLKENKWLCEDKDGFYIAGAFSYKEASRLFRNSVQ